MKNGTLWLDNDGNSIQAHGGCIMQYGDKWYWFGEDKSAETEQPGGNFLLCHQDFIGFRCYSSTDLVHWENEGLSLVASEDPESPLYKKRIGERPVVLYNALTDKFVMWFHHDSPDYRTAEVGLAVSENPTGPYEFLAVGRPAAQDSRDMNCFLDDDGKAYMFSSSNWNATMRILELTPEFTGFTGNTKEIFADQERESPAIFKENGKYYVLTSGCTGWDPNSMLFGESSAIMGHWRLIDDPLEGPNARITYYAQAAHCFKAKGNWYVLFDHWHPDNLKTSAYTILPIQFKDGRMTITWNDEWNGIV